MSKHGVEFTTYFFLSLASTTFLTPANIAHAQGVEVVLDPIIVTGSKRDIDLRKIDSAVAVAGEEELISANVTQTEQLEKIFPELTSRNRSTKIYSLFGLRGASSIDFYNPAVVIYIDGVPQDQTFLTQDLSDAQSVEILKGPQGTLYGKGALGGVINITTIAPGNELETKLSGFIDNRGHGASVRSGGAIVKDKLFLQFSGAQHKKFGFLDNKKIPQNPSEGTNDINKLGGYNGRIKLIYAPTTSPFDATLTASYDYLSSHEENYVPFNNFKEDNIAAFGFELSEAKLKRKVKTVSLNAGYDFGALKFRSITSYQDRKLERVLGTFNNINPEDQNIFTQELRLATPGNNKWLDGVVGLFYQHVDFDRGYGGTFGFTPGFLGDATSVHKVTSTAAFGEATFHATPKLDVTGGVRVSQEKAQVQFDRSGANGFPLQFSGKDTFDNVSLKFSTGYQLTPLNRVYALYSQGFKSGGFNRVVETPLGNNVYENETSDNFEIGFRGETADGQLSYSASIYYTKSYDVQAQIASGPIQILENIGDAETKGAEFSITARPSDEWRFDVAGSFIKTEITKSAAPAPNPDVSGNHIPYVPQSHLVASAQYRLTMKGLPGVLIPRVAANYTGDMYFDVNNTLKQSGFVTFDASLTWEANETFTARLYVENIANKRYRTYAFEVAGFGQFAQVNEGIKGGLRVDARF